MKYSRAVVLFLALCAGGSTSALADGYISFGTCAIFISRSNAGPHTNPTTACAFANSTPVNPASWGIDYCVGGYSYYVCSSLVAANSSYTADGSGKWSCNAGYMPDPTGTSCVPANNCPANMSGSPCACNAGFVLNPYGPGCVVEQFTLSDPQNQTQLLDVEPGSSRAVAARVVSVQTGLPKQGAMVKFHLDVDLTSGGHDHGETTTLRPRGTISSSNCVPEPGAPDTYDCPTGPDGYTDSTFNASKVSGTHTITATCISAHCSGSITDKINVKVDGLLPIPASKYYALQDLAGKVIGAIDGKHSANHYLTGTAITKLEEFAKAYQMKVNPGAKLYLNDASLVWGGLFDVGSTHWTSPHITHDRGRSIDIRAENSGPNNEGAVPPDLFDKTIKAAARAHANAALHCAGSTITSVCSGNPEFRHFHIDF